MLEGARCPYSPEIMTRAEADRLVAPPLGGKWSACTTAAGRSRARRGDISIPIDRYNVNYRICRGVLSLSMDPRGVDSTFGRWASDGRARL